MMSLLFTCLLKKENHFIVNQIRKIIENVIVKFFPIIVQVTHHRRSRNIVARTLLELQLSLES